jgi:hypothetical protein
MKPVSSVPPAMLRRIEVAKESIATAREKARAQGREYRPFFGPLGFDQDAVDIFETLASHSEMQGVWERLSDLFDDTKRPPDTWRFANFCSDTISTWKCSPKRSPAEHREYFERIADDIMSVALRIIGEPEFGCLGSMAARVSVLDMISDDAIRWLMKTTDSDPIDGEYIKDEKGAVSYFRFSMDEVIPNLYAYANWIASDARRIAGQPSISGRPHKGSAQRTFFIKHLSKWFRDSFGKPMHEVVAGVASALFDDEVTADTVRKAAKAEPEVFSQFRRGKVPLK